MGDQVLGRVARRTVEQALGLLRREAEAEGLLAGAPGSTAEELIAHALRSARA